MAQVLYPTSTYIDAPLLIERKSLAQLDSILEKHWERFLKNQEQALKGELDSDYAEYVESVPKDRKPEEFEKWKSTREKTLRDYRRYGRRRVLTISFADGRSLRVQSFSEAYSHAEIINELPVAFELRMSCGDVLILIQTLDLSIPRLTVSTSPEDAEAVQDLFGEIKGWLRIIKPSKWLESWSKAAEMAFFLWLGWFLVLAVLLSNAISTSTDYKSVARQIVEKGVTSENRDQALQTLLAIQADYRPAVTFHPSVGLWIFALGGLIACLILSYPPKIVSGLGKGEQRVSSWKTWIQIVFIFIPLFVASNILAPLLVDLISKKIGP